MKWYNIGSLTLYKEFGIYSIWPSEYDQVSNFNVVVLSEKTMGSGSKKYNILLTTLLELEYQEKED